MCLHKTEYKRGEKCLQLYLQVEQYLLEQIQNGTLKPGDQIPTENELAELFSASRPTIRQALSQLTTLGYLVRTKGKGSFVTKPKVLHESTTFLSGYRREIQKQNLELTTKVLVLEVMLADIKIAKQLEIKVGEKVNHLIRVRVVNQYNNNNPVVYTSVYVPYSEWKEMKNIDFQMTSFYEALTEKGLEVKHASRKLEVILPDVEISEELNISHFEPTIFISSIGRTSTNKIIEYSESYYPAGCSQFLIEIDKK